jgi:hypothetical protein
VRSIRQSLRIIVAAAATMPAAASACPICNSSTGEQIRAGILNEAGIGALAIALPLIATVAVVSIIQFVKGRS